MLHLLPSYHNNIVRLVQITLRKQCLLQLLFLYCSDLLGLMMDCNYHLEPIDFLVKRILSTLYLSVVSQKILLNFHCLILSKWLINTFYGVFKQIYLSALCTQYFQFEVWFCCENNARHGIWQMCKQIFLCGTKVFQFFW